MTGQTGNVTREEFNRYKRFHAEQYQELGSKVVALEAMIKNIAPGPQLAPKAKDFLGKQVEMMFKKIQFLESEVRRLMTKAGE